MDEDQADLLWDNIDTLEAKGEELRESGPGLFQLHGNSRMYDDRPDEPLERWSVWCAAHIPDNSADVDDEPTVILEFELVNDTNNPISSPSPPPSPSLDEANNYSTAQSSTNSPPPSISTVDSDGTVSSTVHASVRRPSGLEGGDYRPSASALRESTVAVHKPLKALSRMRKNVESDERRQRSRRPPARSGPSSGPRDGTGGMLDMFGILSQVNEQFTAQADLDSFLKVVVGIVRDITTFSRVMVYQFDEAWNGQVVCELVDWADSHDLYRGLHFPATDIPAQARALYKINKVRLLYDRDQPTARMVCRNKKETRHPIDMTHSYLRAMSPIHIKYLENMGVRSTMSISIIAFGQLWGLISLHNYGNRGKRVSFPVRQLSRLIGDSVSRNIERLSYTRRLSSRKLINTLPTDANPSGYIISNAEDLLTLFDADFGVIAIGNEAKILGPLTASQEVLAVTEYLRLKKFEHLITSQDVRKDFPDMVLPSGLEVIAGLLLVPLSGSGVDFIAFLRKSQIRHVNWAGKPFKEGHEAEAVLEPRKSFKTWSETVHGTCRAWKDEELETASVLCLVYGKFISVWRQREQALHYNQLNRLLLSNASHEVRTPLNHIINYLELALDSRLDEDTRENLSKSHLASKSLLFVINDLLDLTKQEQGNNLFLQEPFDLAATVREAVEMHEWEAKRRRIDFEIQTDASICMVLGDKNKVRQVVTNTVTNSVKYTQEGRIHVSLKRRPPEERSASLPENCDMEVELVVSDTGQGIPREKLETIFREFEQVESVIAEPGKSGNTGTDVMTSVGSGSDPIDPFTPQSADQSKPDSGLGLGLAIVARIVKNLGGQLRVDSTVGEGSTFTFYMPFMSADSPLPRPSGESHAMRRSNSLGSGSNSSATKSEIDSLVEAIREPILRDQHPNDDSSSTRRSVENPAANAHSRASGSGSSIPGFGRPVNYQRSESYDGQQHIEGSAVPLRSVKVEPQSLDTDFRQTSSGRETKPRRKSAAEAFKEQVQERERAALAFRSGSVSSAPSAESTAVSPLSGPPLVASGLVQSPAPQSSKTNLADSQVESERRSSAAKRRLNAARAMLRANGSGSGPSNGSRNAGAGGISGFAGTSSMSGTSGTAKAGKLPPLRVLVVEDDPINRMILKKRLCMDGHSVLEAVNGEEGVRVFEKNSKQIDVILMDLQMPICNGQEACQRIRDCESRQGSQGELANRPATQVLNGRAPVIAVSATLTSEMRAEMTEIGMDGWVLKPIDFGRLRSIMKGLLELEHREQDQWRPGYPWEKGGWLSEPASRQD